MAYADDLLALINSTAEWQALKDRLALYGSASNAPLNLGKTVAFPITTTPDPDIVTTLTNEGIRWHDQNNDSFLTYLGFPVPLSTNHVDLFFDRLLAKIARCLQIHSQRVLSILGRGTIVNSLALSSLWHVLWAFQPSAAWTLRMRATVRLFMCSFNPKPSWDTICTPRSQGGLGVIDPSTQAIAFQLKHLRNMLSDKVSIGRSLLQSLLHLYSDTSHPLSTILAPASLHAFRAAAKINSVKLLLRAAKTLPRISLPYFGHPLPASETFFASPLSWWVQGLEGHRPFAYRIL